MRMSKTAESPVTKKRPSHQYERKYCIGGSNTFEAQQNYHIGGTATSDSEDRGTGRTTTFEEAKATFL